MSRPIKLRGVPVSAGVAIAPSRVVDRQRIRVPRLRIEGAEVAREQGRLADAVSEAREQLQAALKAIADAGGGHGDHSLIIQAHLLMLDDELLIEGASKLIGEKLINAEWALARQMDEVTQALAGLGDPYLAERSQDVEFVGNRVLRCLLGHVTEILDHDSPGDPCVVIAPFLSPAETAQMVAGPVLAFATEEGTRTSHTAIMAQALGIPAVVGVERLTDHLEAGDQVIIDGLDGIVIIRPDEKLVEAYREKERRFAQADIEMRSTRDQPAVTRDGVEIQLHANIELPAETTLALDYGAQGIGLYRTEFLYLDREIPPTEEEQLEVYRSVIRTMAPRPVIFRTFDIGADKLPDTLPSREKNPALGLRAIRLGFRLRDMFKAQLRALLMAANDGNVKIMFPMISGMTELRQARALVEEAKKELGSRAEGDVEIGCMVELPSAVMISDLLAREVDFFSIGTNDMIQYSLAIDRGNDHVAYLYTPYHPSILRSVRRTIDAGAAAGIDVSICGTAAADPMMLPILLGFGLRTFSMSPTSIPRVKAVVRAIESGDAERLAEDVLGMDSAIDVEDAALNFLKDRTPAQLDLP